MAVLALPLAVVSDPIATLNWPSAVVLKPNAVRRSPTFSSSSAERSLDLRETPPFRRATSCARRYRTPARYRHQTFRAPKNSHPRSARNSRVFRRRRKAGRAADFRRARARSELNVPELPALSRHVPLSVGIVISACTGSDRAPGDVTIFNPNPIVPSGF